MLKDIPYSELKQNGRAYEIMLLRDQDNCTFAHIAKKYSISGPRVMEIYRKTLIQKLHLYINNTDARAVIGGQEIQKRSYMVVKELTDGSQIKVL